MKGIILVFVSIVLGLSLFGNVAFAAVEKCGENDIELNTNIPFIGRCISKDTTASVGGKTTLGNAFPVLMGGLIRVVMAAVVVVGFLAILVGGFMVAAEGAAQTKQKGLQLIKLAIAGLILVGTSGIILNLINPNFFKTNTGTQGQEAAASPAPETAPEPSPDDWAGGEDDGSYDDVA